MKRWGIFILSFLLSLTFVSLSVASAEAADKIRIGVLGFDSKTDGVSHQQAESITDIFTRELASSKTISVYERQQLAKIGEEIKLGMSGLVDMNTAVEVGKLAGVQYILMGSVTELSQKASGAAIPLFGGLGVGGGDHQARATIDIRLVETATSEIKLALSETGSSVNSASAITFSGITFAETEFGGLEARAIADAVTRLAYNIRSIIGGETSHVISLGSNKEYVIDVGSTMGGKEGALYLVYADGKTLTGMSGEVIGQEKLPLAILKVRDVASNHSTCVLAPGTKGELIQRGDKIEPIAVGKGKNMKFVTSRPAKSSGTFEQIFGNAPTDTAGATTPQASAVSQETSAATPQENKAVIEKTAEKAETAENALLKSGFDPNNSTDAKVIQTYPVSSGQANILGIKHRNAYNKFKSGRYKDAYAEFCDAADAYEGNYLSAYWAGVTAHKLKKKDDAAKWMDAAIKMNPAYQPAIEYKGKL